ncbi:MAG: PRC-barrel domain-containing protein [Chakrabartia sp.]
MAIEDENDGNTASSSWVGKGTGSGATEADQKRQTLGTGGTSDHLDETHAGTGSEGGLGSGLPGATSGSGLGASEGGMSQHDRQASPSGNEGVFQDWDTSANPLIASNRVEGTAVYSQSRERLGTIQHIMIDKLSGQSEFAVMSFGGFLGIGSDYYPIPWNKLTYDTEAGGYVVDLTADQLHGAPRYAADEEPDYGSDYSGQVGRYYGV